MLRQPVGPKPMDFSVSIPRARRIAYKLIALK